MIFVDFLKHFLELLICALVGKLTGNIEHLALEPLLQIGIDRTLHELLQVRHQLGAKFVGGHRVPRNADHCEFARQQFVFCQVIKRWDQLAAGKIAGCAKNDHHARIATAPDPLAFDSRCRLRHVLTPSSGEFNKSAGGFGFLCRYQRQTKVTGRCYVACEESLWYEKT